MTNAIPEGMNTLTTNLTVNNASKAIELYKKAFGAKEISRTSFPSPQSEKIGHACIQIGDTKLFLNDMCSEEGSTVGNLQLYMYVEDVDSAHAKAKKAGLTEQSAPEDMFWGDRTGRLKDPYGITWIIATHIRDVSEGEMQLAMQKMMSKAA